MGRSSLLLVKDSRWEEPMSHISFPIKIMLSSSMLMHGLYPKQWHKQHCLRCRLG